VFNKGGIDIDREEYEKGYSLMAFDLTLDLDLSTCFHLIKRGMIRLEVKFPKALDAPCYIVIQVCVVVFSYCCMCVGCTTLSLTLTLHIVWVWLV